MMTTWMAIEAGLGSSWLGQHGRGRAEAATGSHGVEFAIGKLPVMRKGRVLGILGAKGRDLGWGQGLFFVI